MANPRLTKSLVPRLTWDFAMVRRLGNLARAILLLISLVALGAAAAWQIRPSMIKEVERALLRRHTAPFQMRFDEAQAQLEDGDRQGIEQLHQMLVDLQWVHRNDRLGKIKRGCYALLIPALVERGKLDRAILAAEESVRFDGRDLDTQIQLAKLLIQNPERKSEGDAQLAALFVKIPEAPQVAQVYVDFLLEESRYVAAFHVLRDFLEWWEIGAGKPWKVSWDFGDGFNDEQSALITPIRQDDGRLRWHLADEGTVIRWRLSSPPTPLLVIFRPEVSIWDGQQETSQELTELSLECSPSMSTDEQNLWISQEDDPHFVFSLTPSAETRCLSMLAEVLVAPPAWVATIIRSGRCEKIERDLLAQGDEDALRDLRQLRLTLLRQSLVSIQGQTPDDRGSEMRTSRSLLGGDHEDYALRFDVPLSVAGVAAPWKIELPEMFGVEYELVKIEFLTDKQSTSVDLASLSSEIREGIESEPGRLRLQGTDASVSLPLPGNVGPVHYVRIQGVVR